MKKIVIIFSFSLLLMPTKSFSQLDPYVGQISIFAGNFAPRGWAFCDGQILQISQNTALFSILGTTYGGNGTTTFALPDLRGRVPVSAGQGPGLSNYLLGQAGGTESNTLTVNQMPAHSHTVNAVTTDGTTAVPTGALPANTKTLDPEYSSATANTTMNSTMIGNTGGNQAVNNVQPYLSVNYIIALVGIFPPRN